ncbi:MAG: glycosyltransferase family 1 protein [Chloroflexaceae bacterium]|nr:glycosyltransferase family 1 protein [Chloroflexaceae bacterium]
MRYQNIVLISPPFYSHFQPMLALAAACAHDGARVTVACSVAFAAQVQAQEIHFYELNITRNANTGIAQHTDQSRSEAERLNAFLHIEKF